MYSMQQIAVEDPGNNASYLLHNCRVYCYNENKCNCTSHNSSSVLNADVTYRITRSKKLLSPKLWKQREQNIYLSGLRHKHAMIDRHPQLFSRGGYKLSTHLTDQQVLYTHITKNCSSPTFHWCNSSCSWRSSKQAGCM